MREEEKNETFSPDDNVSLQGNDAGCCDGGGRRYKIL